MSMVLGALVLLAAMSYALYVLFAGMRDKKYRYFGKDITRADNPFIFWFTMATMVLCLILGARTLPIYLVAMQ